ncbi:MAG: glycosyltransferase family 4 protein, partial [Gammaproteobacteria bacterium]|nr:glycosyltransferase family 4 protein [candidate division Zixibacteria bacterium]NIR94031.1 glycosyltransferase family 4 protein [Gammaproteobacteria bacterium]NIS47335.1 glycosyltransferase family 4 protein [candidate division Zixibacteria bacterium]NIU15451.1 glycosyltransferase family 4 protein [candidate division Zixibacteria bacterium]NIV07540.1 glycosyltransferase [candidate division Zixibacteria bacterium]
RGWQVTVLTGMPSYPRGKVFEGYGGLLRSDDIDGVRIIRSFVYPTQSANLIPRLINYFSFVISSFFTGLLHIRNADIILTESPPLFLGITGYLLSKAKRTRWIFNVSDLWPESAVRLGAISEGWGLKISQWLERFCYQNADFVSGQSKSILENIKDRFPEISTYHLSNGVDTDIFSPEKFDKSTRQS